MSEIIVNTEYLEALNSIERAILKLKASKGDYAIAITEIVTAG
jgi:hypothetical protein